MRLAALTGRRPWPQAVHTPGGDHPRTHLRGSSIGNAAKWSTPSHGGTVRGWEGMSHTDPGSFPSGLYSRGVVPDRPKLPLVAVHFVPRFSVRPVERHASDCGSRISSTAA